MNISVKLDSRSFLKGMKAAYKNQIPFATSKAINLTARQAVEGLRKHARGVFTVRGTFTTRNITMKAGNKRDPEATVGGIPDYLRLQAEGGTKSGKSRAVPTAHVRTSPRVRITKSKFPASLAKRGGKNTKPFFTKLSTGVGALVKPVKGGGIKALYLFPKKVKVTRRFKFFPVVERAFNEHFEKNSVKALDDALRTAR